jgi:hypothetical protein
VKGRVSVAKQKRSTSFGLYPSKGAPHPAEEEFAAASSARLEVKVFL